MRNDLLAITKRLSGCTRYEDSYIVQNVSYASDDTLVLTVKYAAGDPYDSTVLLEEKKNEE